MNSNVSICPASISSSYNSVFLLSEFIRQLSNDPAYDIVYNDYDAHWKYDVNSDITYDAQYYKNPFTNSDTIGLSIFKGHKLIDSARFERLEATYGFIWEEII